MLNFPIIPVVLGILLAISTAGNAWLTSQWLETRDRATLAEERQSTAASAATEVSAQVAELQTQAEEREAKGKVASAGALQAALRLEQTAQQILASAPAVPGDDCRSAQVRASEWAKGRAKP